MAGAVRDVRTLPKAHLHLHLEGSMRPSTVSELAARAGAPVPVLRPGEGFDAFLAAYDAVCDLIRFPADLARLFVEVAEDARRDGCVWIEPHVYPPLLSRHLGDPVAVLEFMVEAAAAATSATGVGIGLLLSADRSGGPDEASRWASLAARFAGRGVTTFGLAGDESRHPAGPFAAAFAVARHAGLLSAPHAGELAGPDSVRDTLSALAPHRLAHGVRIADDEAVMGAVADRGVVCDVCPTSNVTLGIYRSLGDHPLPRLVAAGVPVTLNADDPLFVDTSLAGEYERARRDLALGDEVLARIARTSIDASAAPNDVKAQARAGIAAWIGPTGRHSSSSASDSSAAG